MAGSSGSAGKIIVDLLLNKKEYEKGLEQAKNDAKESAKEISNSLGGADDGLDKVGDAAKKVGKYISAAFSVAAVAKFAKECIDVTSRLQEVQNVVDVTFGKNAGKVNSFAKQAADAYGLSELMAKEYMGTFGAMAKGVGFADDSAYALAQTLTGLSGDVASFYNISQDEAFTKLKSVFTGETESLKSLGVVMSQTNLDAFALANGWGTTTANMDQATLSALRLAFVQSQLSAAQGDWARTSDSYSNSVKNLEIKWEEFENTLGVFFMQIAGPVVQGLSNIIEEVNAFVRSLGVALHLIDEENDIASDPLSKTADSASNIDQVLQDIQNTTVGVAGASTGAGRAATKAAKNTGKAVTNLGKKMKSVLGFDQINKLSEAAKNTGKASSGAGGGGVGGGGGLSFKKASTPKISTPKVPVKKKSKKQQTAEENKHNYVDPIKNKMTAKKNAQQLKRWNNKPIGPNYTKVDFKKTQESNIDAAKKNMSYGPNGAKIPKATTDAYAKAHGEYKGTITAPVKVDAKKDAKNLWKDIKKLFTGTNKKVQKDGKTKIEAKGSVKMESADEITKKFSDSTAGIHDIERKATLSMPNKTDVSSGWKDKTSGVTDKTKKASVSMPSKTELTTSWKDKTSGIKDVKKKASMDLTASMKTGSVKDTINTKFIDVINKKLQGISIFGAKPFKNIKIPHLAEGGYVKANAPQLAMIGDNKRYGEIVSPENKLQEMANAAASANNQQIISLLNAILKAIMSIDTDAYLDGNKVTDVVLKNINARTKARGKSVVIT